MIGLDASLRWHDGREVVPASLPREGVGIGAAHSLRERCRRIATTPTQFRVDHAPGMILDCRVQRSPELLKSRD